MTYLPEDPMMLYSVINTRLRDQYGSLEALCEDLDVSEIEIRKKLSEAGFVYDPELNQFV